MPEWTLVSIAICQIIITATIFLTAALMVIGVFMIRNMINRKADEAMAKVQPIINQAKAISDQTRDTVEEVSAKVDSIMTRVDSTTDRLSNTVESMAGQVNTTVGSIMSKAESTVDQVSGSVTGVSKKVEEAVNPQIATAASLVGTAAKCYEIFQDISKMRQAKQGNGKESSEPDQSSI